VYSPAVDDQYAVQWRCANYAGAITHTGLNQANLLSIDDFVRNTPEAQEKCRSADLIIIHRYFFTPVFPPVTHWKRMGKKVIVDLDEPLHYLQPGGPDFDFWHEGKPYLRKLAVLQDDERCIDPSPLEQLQWGLRLVDAVTTPTERMASDWEPFARVFHLPDYPDLHPYRLLKTRPHEGVCIGFNGAGLSGDAPVDSGLSAALTQVCRKRPNVKLILYGLKEAQLASLRVPRDQVFAYEWRSMEDWLIHLAMIDIGLAPASGNYDLRTSPTRLVEYMAMKIPWLASDQQPYRDFQRHGWLVPNQADAWEGSLHEIVDHLEAYRAEAESGALVYVLSQDVVENIDKVLSVYQTILQTQKTVH
jgi:glycosyltransferase involved in cell wall biosynthesis